MFQEIRGMGGGIFNGKDKGLKKDFQKLLRMILIKHLPLVQCLDIMNLGMKQD